MTSLLEKAFTQASKLSEAEQDLLASLLLAELAAESAFDQAIDQSAHKLADRARKSLREFRQGKTLPLDPNQL